MLCTYNCIDDYGNIIQGFSLQDEIELEFGDPSNNISSELDKLRREEAFKILCIVRFVRVGLTVSETPLGPVLPPT